MQSADSLLESNLFSSSHVLLLLSSPTQPIAQFNTIDDHQPRGSTVLVFYRYLRHFTDQISLPPTPGPRITHRIEHAGNRLLLFCRSTYRAGPRPAFVALLFGFSVDPYSTVCSQFDLRFVSFRTCFVASPSLHPHLLVADWQAFARRVSNHSLSEQFQQT